MTKANKTIPARSRGQHIGYAVEANLRGLLKSVYQGPQYSIEKSLPFEFHVRPDIVVLENGKVKRVFIVAYNTVQENSNMKFYRTRSEFIELLKECRSGSDRFCPDFTPVIFFYGSESGWKDAIINDLKSDYQPFIFLPVEIGIAEAQEQVAKIFSDYSKWFSTKGANALSEIEEKSQLQQYVYDKKICKILAKLKAVPSNRDDAHKEAHDASLARAPAELFSSRYRQGLSIFSLLPFYSLEFFLLRLIPPPLDDDKIRFIRLVKLLDLGDLIPQRRVGLDPLDRIKFFPRDRIDLSTGKRVAFKPDFYDFLRIEEPKLKSIVSKHRAVTKYNPKTFNSGAIEHCIGNIDFVIDVFGRFLPLCSEYLGSGQHNKLLDVINKSPLVSPPAWLDEIYDKAFINPVWEAVVCALRMSQQISNPDAQVHSPAAFRFTANGKHSNENLLSTIAHSDTSLAADLLNEAAVFVRTLGCKDVSKIVSLEKPRLFDLDTRESWSNANYRAITTNKSHNPLNILLGSLLRYYHGQYKMFGWPDVRSVALSHVFDSDTVGRTQWQMIGKSARDGFLFAESRTITLNNWGNKSKEIFDRISEVRLQSSKLGIMCITICLIDGDVDSAVMEELKSSRGYDYVYSVDEAVALYDPVH